MEMSGVRRRIPSESTAGGDNAGVVAGEAANAQLTAVTIVGTFA